MAHFMGTTLDPSSDHFFALLSSIFGDTPSSTPHTAASPSQPPPNMGLSNSTSTLSTLDVPKALVTSWTLQPKLEVKVKCPYHSCKHLTIHTSTDKVLKTNTFEKAEECSLCHFQYKIIFPFEEHELTNGLGYKCDETGLKWTTYGSTSAVVIAEAEIVDETSALADHVTHMSPEDREQFRADSLKLKFYCTGTIWITKINELLQRTSDPFALLDSVGLPEEGETSERPIFEAFNLGMYAVAHEFLRLGASIELHSLRGQTVLNYAITDLSNLELEVKEDQERLVGGSPAKSAVLAIEKKVENLACLKRIIAHCEARNQSLDGLLFAVGTGKPITPSGHSIILWQQSEKPQRTDKGNVGHAVNEKVKQHAVSSTSMAGNFKTTALIQRQFGFADIRTMGGFAAVPIVLQVSALIGHQLDAREGSVTTSSTISRIFRAHRYVAHAEKHAVAQFLLDHSELRYLLEKKRSGFAAGKRSPAQVNAEIRKLMSPCMRGAPGIAKKMHLTAAPCEDCVEFLKKVELFFGIAFEVVGDIRVGYVPEVDHV